MKFTFASPYALFLEQMATPLGQHPTLFPKHYCGQFHPKYNPAVADLVKQANMSQLGRRCSAPSAATSRSRRAGAIPTSRRSTPGSSTEPYTGGATRVTMERNPYFWQVDTEGNQLPYIDRITFSISQDVESLMLDAVSGRLDIQDRHIDTLQNKPTLSQNMKKGGYRLVELVVVPSQQCQIYFNITHKDPKMREMFANKEFRQALSLGINRKEIIDIVYLGQSEPYQAGPRRAHPWYHEKLAGSTPSSSQAKANAMLDRLGYNKRDAQGVAPAARRPEDVLRRRRDPDALSRPGRHAGAGEAALGRDRRRHEGQHHRARALLHARRQQRP